MKNRRWIVVACILAAVGLGIGYAFAPRPVPVETAPVVRGDLAETVEEEGKTRVTDRFTVSAPVAGVARRIAFDVGARVPRGTELLSIDPAAPPFLDARRKETAGAKVKAAEAALESARDQARAAAAKEEYARATVERAGKLHRDGYSSRDELEAAESAARQAQAALRSAEHAVELAASELEAARAESRSAATGGTGRAGERVVVRSPVEGEVLAVLHRSEGVVREGEPLIVIGNPRALEVEVDVLSPDAVRIRPGSRVVFTRWGGEAALEGRVRTVEPSGFTKVSALGVEEQRVLVIADIVSPRGEWEKLGDGYRLEASFVLWEGKGVLRAPAAALFRRGDGWAAFVAEGGRARLKPVTPGRRSGLAVQVLSGLREGESVVVHPDEKVADGVRIRAGKGEEAR
jgi:HlyD family secretion protein